ncbi:transposase [Rhodospirillum sp. A1_3_36]|uniref:transposase n=1 Tax=Rhodospirillum sp. A1_3_36 TaxID=3391666 RepID=UPI0039A7874C
MTSDRWYKSIGEELRAVWNAKDLVSAQTELADLVAHYRESAPRLARWLEENIPEGLAVFTLPNKHRRRMRTSNPIERAVQQEIKRSTKKVRVFPNEASSPRSTKSGKQPTASTSTWKSRMRDNTRSNFTDKRLLNPTFTWTGQPPVRWRRQSHRRWQ